MVAGIRSYLAAAGLDVAHKVRKGSLVLSSDQNHLVNGRFDVDNMQRLLSDAVDRALSHGYHSLWATGDMSWEFGGEQDFSKLLEYEWGLENLFRRQPALTGACQYHTLILRREAIRTGLQTHQTVYLNETLNRINPYFVPAGAKAAAAQRRIEEMLKYFQAHA